MGIWILYQDIYEGDKFVVTVGSVPFGGFSGIIEYEMSEFVATFENETKKPLWEIHSSIEVIGSIHTHPDLLKQKV
jgi:hypothetical protein